MREHVNNSPADAARNPLLQVWFDEWDDGMIFLYDIRQSLISGV